MCALSRTDAIVEGRQSGACQRALHLHFTLHRSTNLILEPQVFGPWQDAARRGRAFRLYVLHPFTLNLGA